MPSRVPHSRIKKKTAAPKVDQVAPVAMEPVGRGSDGGDGGGALSPAKRRVMLVADSGRESAIALQWALSHAILEHDELILLHVEAANAPRRGSGGGGFSAFLRRPSSLGTGVVGGASIGGHGHLALSSLSLSSTSSSSSSSSSTASAGSGMSPSAPAGAGEGAEYEFLEAMRAACEAAQPKIRVQIERVEMEGRDKAAAILSQTKILGVDLLVIGQRRPASTFLGCKLSGSMSGKGLDMAEFLIEHCKCLCVGVQKKGQNAGYLLNTKTHKNFWLLA